MIATTRKLTQFAGKLMRNAYFVLAAFVVATALLMQAGPLADSVLVVSSGLLILVASIVVVFRMFRRGGSRRVGYGQTAIMGERVRRWVLDKQE